MYNRQRNAQCIIRYLMQMLALLANMYAIFDAVAGTFSHLANMYAIFETVSQYSIWLS
jgi:hypothetical protein